MSRRFACKSVCLGKRRNEEFFVHTLRRLWEIGNAYVYTASKECTEQRLLWSQEGKGGKR